MLTPYHVPSPYRTTHGVVIRRAAARDKAGSIAAQDRKQSVNQLIVDYGDVTRQLSGQEAIGLCGVVISKDVEQPRTARAALGGKE